MRIAVFEGLWNEQAQGSWDELARLGDLTVYPHCTRAEALERARDAEIFVTGSVTWDAELFDAAPHARMLALTGTGYDKIDLAEATRRGVVVCNARDYASYAVAQTALALLLELTNHVGSFDAAIREGAWDVTRSVCGMAPISELAGKIMGIVGMGNIGQTVAHMARGLGMDVIFWDRSLRPAYETDRIRQVTFDELLRGSDVISLHCCASEETYHMIDADALARMKPGALIINTARGSLIDEPALAEALAQGKLAGAGLDVLEHEPIKADDPLLSLPHVVLTPHVGWMARESLGRLLDQIAANIKAFLAGDPINVVNPDVLPFLSHDKTGTGRQG